MNRGRRSETIARSAFVYALATTIKIITSRLKYDKVGKRFNNKYKSIKNNTINVMNGLAIAITQATR